VNEKGNLKATKAGRWQRESGRRKKTRVEHEKQFISVQDGNKKRIYGIAWLLSPNNAQQHSPHNANSALSLFPTRLPFPRLFHKYPLKS